MNNRGLTIRRRWIASAAGFLAIILLGGGALAVGEVDILALLQSFQQLGMIDPSSAGAVWMEETAATNWNLFVGSAVDETAKAIALFQHTFWLTAFSETQTPYGGLLHPWSGLLLIFRLDDRAASIEAFRIETFAAWNPSDPLDPVQTALALMALIEEADRRMREAAQEAWDQQPHDETNAADRLADYTELVRWIHAPADARDREQQAIADALDRLAASDPRSALLRTGDEEWLPSLLPVYLVRSPDSIQLVCAAPNRPLDLVLLDLDPGMSGDTIRSTSVLRLFDSVFTQGGAL